MINDWWSVNIRLGNTSFGQYLWPLPINTRWSGCSWPVIQLVIRSQCQYMAAMARIILLVDHESWAPPNHDAQEDPCCETWQRRSRIELGRWDAELGNPSRAVDRGCWFLLVFVFISCYCCLLLLVVVVRFFKHCRQCCGWRRWACQWMSFWDLDD